MASNNFLQWNAGKVNQDNDSEYVLETQRVGGAVSGLFPSKLANKLFYQCSIMAAAMGEMMKGKGFEMSDAVFADLITSLSHILTDAQFGSSAGTVCQGNDPRLGIVEVPSGSKMWFYQNVAPTGWTIDSSVADTVIAVKGGTGQYIGNGGTQGGTWTQPNHTHTGGSHTHTTGNFTLTIDEMPSHRHIIPSDDGTGRTGYEVPSVADNHMYDYGTPTHLWNAPTTNTGGSKAHNHGATGAGGTEATGASATANTWRPLAALGIICTKN